MRLLLAWLVNIPREPLRLYCTGEVPFSIVTPVAHITLCGVMLVLLHLRVYFSSRGIGVGQGGDSGS